MAVVAVAVVAAIVTFGLLGHNGTVAAADLAPPADPHVARYAITSKAREYQQTYTKAGAYDGAKLAGNGAQSLPRWIAVYGSRDQSLIVEKLRTRWHGKLGEYGKPGLTLAGGTIVVIEVGSLRVEEYDAAIALLRRSVHDSGSVQLPRSLGPGLDLAGTQASRPDVWKAERRARDGERSFEWTITAQTFSAEATTQYLSWGDLRAADTPTTTDPAGGALTFLHEITQAGPDPADGLLITSGEGNEERACVTRPITDVLVLTGCRIGPKPQIATSLDDRKTMDQMLASRDELIRIVSGAVVSPAP